jgi:GTP-binding protein HflX
VVNKIDSADPVVLQGLRAREPGSLSVSAKTGAGLAVLRDAIDAALPRLDVLLKLVVPYRRSDLVARAHAEGEVLSADHAADGTLLEARVPAGLAVQLEAAALEAAALDESVRVQA